MRLAHLTLAIKLSDDVGGVDLAGPAPGDELHRVDPAVARLRAVDQRVVALDAASQGPLGEPRLFAEPAEGGREPAVRERVLGSCCHFRSTLLSPDPAAISAASGWRV